MHSVGDLREPFFPIHETLKFKTRAWAEEFFHEVLLLDKERKAHQLASEQLHHRIGRQAALLRGEQAFHNNRYALRLGAVG
jgi:hypothetical protein